MEPTKLTLDEINKIMDKCKYCWNDSCMCLVHQSHAHQRQELIDQ